MATTVQLQDLDTILKEVVAPVIQKEFFDKNVFLGHLSKNKGVTLANGKFEIPVQTSRFSGIYAIAEGEDPLEGTVNVARMEVNAKYVFGQFTLTDQALEGTSSNIGALVDILTFYSQNAKESMEREISRMVVNGYGQGVLANVTADSTGTTITVDSTFYIEPGMQLLIGTKAEIEAGTADNVTVTQVLNDTQFKVNTAVTVATGDRVVKQKVYDDVNGVYNEWAGIRNLIDNNDSPYDDNFQGVPRSTNAWVNAPVYKPSSSEVLTIARMREYYIKALKYGNPNLILMGPKLFQKYIDLLEENVRPARFDTQFGTFEGVAFTGQNSTIPVILDHDVTEDEVYILDTSTFTIGEMTPVSWMDRGGGILQRTTGQSTKYSATLRYYGNLICFSPRANARLTNMTD